MKSRLIRILLPTVLLILILATVYRVISTIQNPVDTTVQTIEINYPETTFELQREILLPLESITSLTTDFTGTYYILGEKRLLFYTEDFRLTDEVLLDYKPQAVKYITDMGLVVVYENSVILLDNRGHLIESLWDIDKKSLITSLEVVDNYLFLLDAFNKRVIRMDLETEEVKSFYRYDGRRFIIPSPHFEIVKSLGSTIWITDTGRHRVIQFDTDLNMLSSFGEGAFTLEGFVGCCNPSNISLTQEGNIITSEKGEKRVKMYSYSGEYLGLIERFNNNGPEIIDLIMDKKNSVHMLVGKYWRVYSEKDK